MPNKKGDGWNPVADNRRNQGSSRSNKSRGSADNRRGASSSRPSGSPPSGSSGTRPVSQKQKSVRPKIPFKFLSADSFLSLLEPSEGAKITTHSAFMSEVSSSEKELYLRVMFFLTLPFSQTGNGYIYYPTAIKFEPNSLLAPFASELVAPAQVLSMKLYGSSPTTMTVLYGLPVRSGNSSDLYDPSTDQPTIVATKSTNFVGPNGVSGGGKYVVADQCWTEIGGFNMDSLHLTSAALLRNSQYLHLGTVALVDPFTGAPLTGTDSDAIPPVLRCEVLCKQALPTLVVSKAEAVSGGTSDPDLAWNYLPGGDTPPSTRPGQITSVSVRRTE